MRSRPALLGFTLVELLITVAVTALVLSGAIIGMRAQQKAYFDGQRLREAQTSARRALLAIEKTLPSAGNGMDAPLAFDFSGWTTGPCPTTMGTCAGDSTSTSDELTFFARDPTYWSPAGNRADLVGHAWRIQYVNTSQVSIAARPGDVFYKGQIFLAVCPGAASYAYFTSSGYAANTGANKAFLQIPLAPAVTSNPFRRQDLAAPAAGCFNTNSTSAAWGSATGDPTNDAARLFLIDKYRFHVRPAQTGTLGTVPIYDPLLVLDRGLDLDNSGVVDDQDEIIVAEGIESLQVAYSFYNGAIPQAGTTPGNPVASIAGTPASATTSRDTLTTTTFPGTIPAGQSAYQPSSFYPYTYGPPPDPVRQTNHQANVQLVRIAVLARSLETDIQASMRADQFLPLLNQNTAPSWVTAYAGALGGHDGYQRVVLESTIPLPNLAIRGMAFF